MSVATSRAVRPGKTEKISISLDRAELSVLRRRARNLYGGNISAAVNEGVRRIREEEGREALVAWLGTAGDASREERDALRAEWRRSDARRARKRSRAR